MREKLLFLGMLAMSVMYCIEAIPNRPYTPLNYVCFAIAAVTIIPWCVSQIISYRKWRKRREAEKARKESERAARAKEKAQGKARRAAARPAAAEPEKPKAQPAAPAKAEPGRGTIEEA